MNKFNCPLKNCRYSTTSEQYIRNHVVTHNPELIFDFAFEKGLLPGATNNDTFHYVVNRIVLMECLKNHE